MSLITPRRRLATLVASVVVAAVLVPLAAPPAPALTTGTAALTALDTAYTQDFNTLATTGTANTTLPTGWALHESGESTRNNDAYASNSGIDNAGDVYSFGAAANTERAFGGIQSNTLIPVIGVAFKNDTGALIASVDVAYTGEQWRLGAVGRGPDRLDIQISTDATSLVSTGTFTSVDSLDFSSPIQAGTVGALDGNNAANRTSISGAITGLAIQPGATFWIRWLDRPVDLADDGLSVDDFSLTPRGTPAGKVSTVTQLSSAPNPSVVGESVTITALVCALSGTAAPTGSMTITDTTASDVVVAPVATAPSPASGDCAARPSAFASWTTTQMGLGPHFIIASYSPEDPFLASGDSMTHQVNRPSVTASLTSSANPSLPGAPVTLTATFCGTGGVRPTGDVIFKDGASTLATVALANGANADCGTASFTTATLSPGSHAITAVFGGDANYAGTTASLTQTVNCTGTCIDGGTTAGGSTVGPGGTLFIKNATVNGSISAHNARSVVICGSTIKGSLSISGTAGFVLVGGDGQGGCAGNVFANGVTLTNNAGGLRFGGNRTGGTVAVYNNRASGTDLVTGGAAKHVVRNNNVGGHLACAGNVPPVTNEGAPNTVFGSRTGECVGL